MTSTVKLQDGKVLTKEGKVSCSCCEIDGRCTIEWETSSVDLDKDTLEQIPVDDRWVVSLNGSRIRYNIEDSVNCNGTNENIQTGVAVATIEVVGESVLLGFAFTGIAEEQETGFENISFYLNNVLVASATSPGSNEGDNENPTCEMGPAIQTFIENPPYLLEEGEHEFRIEFTTSDELYHVGSFYQADFTCEPAPEP